ncbi:MAG: DNA integrity scanning protein DisA nucleotide-binding domain protein [Candidatus Borkfalkiaceae bacterium]|nr:DNA integrity scanning protein DisA nucleotide-binding domain protein [Christensenellaceae bacterium]
MEFLKSFAEKAVAAFTSSPVQAALTIVLLFFVIFYAVSVMERNNAGGLVVVFVLYVLLSGVAFMALKTENTPGVIYVVLPLLFILAVVVLFATEIKRDIWDIGKKKGMEMRHVEKGVVGNPNVNVCIDEIVKALQNMSKNDVGALIILGNGNLPKTVIDSGVVIDSDISSALIESIFFPKTPLHDGAMVINGSRIQAAGCFLPLSQEINLPQDLGTRHRAGIGITETINVTSLIVSEETGIISIAQGGKIKRYADSEMLRQTLKEYYWQDLLGNRQ